MPCYRRRPGNCWKTLIRVEPQRRRDLVRIREQKERKEPDPQLNQLTSSVLGAAIEVHRELGPGFLESVYEEALCHELQAKAIPFQRQFPVHVEYKGKKVGEGRVDLLVAQQIIIELKAIEGFSPIHSAQVISYLKATGLTLALLINFNVPVLKDGIKRVVLS